MRLAVTGSCRVCDTARLLVSALISQAPGEHLTLGTAEPQMQPYGVPLMRTEARPNRTSLTNATTCAVDSACERHKANSPEASAARRLALGGRSRCLAGCPRTHGGPLDSLGPSTRESDRRRSVQGDSRRSRTSRRGPGVESRAVARSHPTTSQGGSNSASVLTPLTLGLTARDTETPLRGSLAGSAQGCS